LEIESELGLIQSIGRGSKKEGGVAWVAVSSSFFLPEKDNHPNLVVSTLVEIEVAT
jgi:hypothetical protein